MYLPSESSSLSRDLDGSSYGLTIALEVSDGADELQKIMINKCFSADIFVLYAIIITIKLIIDLFRYATGI